MSNVVTKDSLIEKGFKSAGKVGDLEYMCDFISGCDGEFRYYTVKENGIATSDIPNFSTLTEVEALNRMKNVLFHI
jgi:hypothetical protein